MEENIKYIYPSFQDELNNLEDEVQREMLGSESSFTTQRKVFQFLINDLERENTSLCQEFVDGKYKLQHRLDELSEMINELRQEMDCKNTENKHLRETIVFFGNQLNQRLSNSDRSSSSTVSESVNSSAILDEILTELKSSTSKSENCIACREERSTNTSTNTSPQCTQTPLYSTSAKDTQTSSLPRYDQSTQTPTIFDSFEDSEDVFEKISENIALKDILIKQLER